jgi:hypothetical protein
VVIYYLFISKPIYLVTRWLDNDMLHICICIIFKHHSVTNNILE